MCTRKEKKFLAYEWKKYIGGYEWWYWLEEGLYNMGRGKIGIYSRIFVWDEEVVVVGFPECVWMKPPFPNLTW